MDILLVPELRIRHHHPNPSSESHLGAQVIKGKEDRSFDCICIWFSVINSPIYTDALEWFRVLTGSRSACVAAILRIVTSVQYLESTDKTFAVSAVALCCWTEMVFLFMVACVPSVPVVLRSFGAPKALASLKLWASQYYGKTEASNVSYTRPRTSEQSPYARIDEYNLKPRTGVQDDEYRRPPNESASAIVRTTHVVTYSEEHDPNLLMAENQSQHPWAKYNHSQL